MTPNDILAGEPALKAYVQQIAGWFQAGMISEYNYQKGTTDLIAAADKAADQSQGARAIAGGHALYNDIVNAGYGSRVTAAQCIAAASLVLVAVAHIRHPGA